MLAVEVSMRCILLSAAALLLFAATFDAQSLRVDGANDVLAIVNGQAITYHEIISDSDIQAEINAWRAYQQVDAQASDEQIENLIVMQRLPGFVLQRLLDSEAKKINLNITDSQMRAVIQRERRSLGIREDQTREWALYLKERYNLSPSEYRVRRRQEITRNETMNYMAGAYGPLPPQYPLEVYFSLSVTPRDVRKEYDKDPEQYKYAYDIRYSEFILKFPSDTDEMQRDLLTNAVRVPENGVRARVLKGESLDEASQSLRRLIEEQGVPGAEVITRPESVAADDTSLEPIVYRMVLSLPETGGVSELAAYQETDEDGTAYGGVRFIKLISCRFGQYRVFGDPKVQEAIRDQLFSQRLAENRVKVEQELLRRAAIVPELSWFRR
jgi:hypothetical protein